MVHNTIFLGDLGTRGMAQKGAYSVSDEIPAFKVFYEKYYG